MPFVQRSTVSGMRVIEWGEEVQDDMCELCVGFVGP